MTTLFSFKRPERNPWNWAWVLAVVAMLIWYMVPNSGLEPKHFTMPAVMSLYMGIRLWRFRKLPPLSLEIDEQEIRLLPPSHWGIDPIPRASVTGVNEERTSMFVLYRRNGADKAFELERHFFDGAAWQQLLQILQPLPSKKSAEAAAGVR